METPTNTPLMTIAGSLAMNDPIAKPEASPSTATNRLYAKFVPEIRSEKRSERNPEGEGRSPRLLRTTVIQSRQLFGAFWRAITSRPGYRPKLLVLNETVALGDRRFVAVVQFGQQRFLIGTSPSSVSLLAPLPDDNSREPMPVLIAPETDSVPGAGR